MTMNGIILLTGKPLLRRAFGSSRQRWKTALRRMFDRDPRVSEGWV